MANLLLEELMAISDLVQADLENTRDRIESAQTQGRGVSHALRRSLAENMALMAKLGTLIDDLSAVNQRER